jgi:hypothetical protein
MWCNNNVKGNVKMLAENCSDDPVIRITDGPLYYVRRSD